MAVYKIYYSGFAYVEADDEAEAKEMYWEGDSHFEQERITDVKLVDENEIGDELR